MARPEKTVAITPFVPPVLNAITFAQIKERQALADRTSPQHIRKGEDYFHHVKTGYNYTYNGFIGSDLVIVSPFTGQNIRVGEKQFIKEFKFAGPATQVIERKKVK